MVADPSSPKDLRSRNEKARFDQFVQTVVRHRIDDYPNMQANLRSTMVVPTRFLKWPYSPKLLGSPEVPHSKFLCHSTLQLQDSQVPKNWSQVPDPGLPSTLRSKFGV